jgi:predicted Mrr-cat superfamily restriction endonuclease
MIELISIKDQGNLTRERVVFRVVASGDIGSMIVLCAATRLREGATRLQNVVHHCYWFLDKKVEVGDLVILYTKDERSNYKIKSSEDGKNSHFFYWKLKETIWDKDFRSAVVGKFSGWKSSINAISTDDIEP